MDEETYPSERMRTARAIRNIRKIITRSPPIEEVNVDRDFSSRWIWVSITLAILAIILLFSCQPAHAERNYSDEEIAQAIYKAEGGDKAQYPYGIRSVACSGKSDCHKVCINTIRHTKRRFARHGQIHSTDFITFLGKTYCPINGKKLSVSEIRVNRFWVKNVKYFLNKGTV